MQLVQIAQNVPELAFGSAGLRTANRGYYVYMTEACNIRCNYCFVDDKHNHNHLFDPVSYEREAGKDDMLLKVVDWILKDPDGRSSKYVHFFGGEPLIRAKSIDRFCQLMKDRAPIEVPGCSITYGITTNGTLLTEENCLMMKKWNIGVQMSLDGSEEGNDVHRQIMGGDQKAQGMTQNQNEETHGRKYGAFKMVKIDNYLKHFGTNARMTLTVHNLKYLVKSVDDLRERGFKSFSVIPDSDAGEWNAHLEEYRDQIEKLWLYSLDHPDVLINFIHDVNSKLMKANEMPEHLCQAGRNVVGISVSGALWPCHDFLGKFSKDPAEVSALQIGHIDQGWTTNTEKFSDLKCDDEIKSGAGHDCKTCHAKTVCERGCPYVNYTSTGVVKTVSEAYCRLTRINVDIGLRMTLRQGKLRSTAPADLPVDEVLKVVAYEHFKQTAPFGKNSAGVPLLPGPAVAKSMGLEAVLQRGVGSKNGQLKPPARVGAETEGVGFDGEQGRSSFISHPVIPPTHPAWFTGDRPLTDQIVIRKPESLALRQ